MAQVHIFQQAGDKPWRVVAQNRNAGTRTWDVESVEDAIAKAKYALAEEARGEAVGSDAAIFVRLTELNAAVQRLAESHVALNEKQRINLTTMEQRCDRLAVQVNEAVKRLDDFIADHKKLTAYRLNKIDNELVGLRKAAARGRATKAKA